MVSLNDAGTYKCVAKNYHRSIEATSVVKVLCLKPKTCSEIRSKHPGSSSGNYIIDPDGNGGVTSYSVYCDMNHKGRVGVTVISHHSESRTHVGNIPECNDPGCYRKDVSYQELLPPSWQRLLEFHITANSSSRMSASTPHHLLRLAMPGGCHVME